MLKRVVWRWTWDEVGRGDGVEMRNAWARDRLNQATPPILIIGCNSNPTMRK